MWFSKRSLLYSLGLFALCFVGIPIKHDKPSEAAFSTDESASADIFHNYMQQFNKTYVKGSAEYTERLKNFKESLRRIETLSSAHNDSHLQSHHRAKFGLTKFSDMSEEEFRQVLLKHQSNSSCLKEAASNSLLFKKRTKRVPVLKSASIPLKKDWREEGVITAVKNQKNCGACWAFSTVETIESMHALATGQLQELSVQQMIDCAQSGNMGCLGGDTCTALRWLALTNTSLVRDHEYPLKYRKDYCSIAQQDTGVRIAANYTCYNLVQSEEALQILLAGHGPVTAAVDATMWQDYLGGIMRYHCESKVNHAVQIVGYDKTGPVPFYIARNSWGTDWGSDGYLYIEMGKNLCGIAREVSAIDVLS